MADYVLVWAGGGGDDLAKSPHMARIGNSIYSDMCPGDPTCRQFGFNRDGSPTKMMRESLLYKLTQYGYKVSAAAAVCVCVCVSVCACVHVCVCVRQVGRFMSLARSLI